MISSVQLNEIEPTNLMKDQPYTHKDDKIFYRGTLEAQANLTLEGMDSLCHILNNAFYLGKQEGPEMEPMVVDAESLRQGSAWSCAYDA